MTLIPVHNYTMTPHQTWAGLGLNLHRLTVHLTCKMGKQQIEDYNVETYVVINQGSNYIFRPLVFLLDLIINHGILMFDI